VQAVGVFAVAPDEGSDDASEPKIGPSFRSVGTSPLRRRSGFQYRDSAESAVCRSEADAHAVVRRTVSTDRGRVSRLRAGLSCGFKSADATGDRRLGSPWVGAEE